MSGSTTHMLIGAVGGLALAQVGHSANVLARLGAHDVTPLVFAGASALLAVWPDIDERDSWISHRARGVLVVFCIAWGAFVGWWLAQSPAYWPNILQSLATWPLGLTFWSSVLGGGVALIVSPLVSDVALRAVRLVSGGHRHLTHSLTAAVVLGIVAYLGRQAQMEWLWLLAGGLVWGEALHLIGDVVTPAGVPLFFPLSKFPFRLFPHFIAVHGEWLIALMAALVGAYLLWH